MTTAPPKNFSRAARLKRRGFTLLELLLVVAIMLVLMAIMVPLYGDVMGRLRVLECHSNLRKFGPAFRMYTRDHGGRFPPMQAMGHPRTAVEQMAQDTGLTLNQGNPMGGYHWSIVLWSYHRSLDSYTCPSDPAAESPEEFILPATRSATPFADGPPLSYGLNTLLFRAMPAYRNLAGASWGLKAGEFQNSLTFTSLADQKRQIPYLGLRILMFCGTSGFPIGNQSSVAWRDSGIAKRSEWHPRPGPKPFEDAPGYGSNYLFYDGSIEYREDFPARYEWALDLRE